MEGLKIAVTHDVDTFMQSFLPDPFTLTLEVTIDLFTGVSCVLS